MDEFLQQLSDEGQRLYQRGEYEAAAGIFEKAVRTCTVGGNFVSAAEMRNNQCVALLRARQPQRALEAVAGTEDVFAKAGDLRRQGMALANQAAVLEALKRTDRAIDLYQQSASVLEKAGENQLRAEALRSLAALQARHGKMTDAVIAMQDGLMGVKKPSLMQRILKKLMFLKLWK